MNYNQVMRELYQKKSLLEQAILKELLLDPTSVELRPDDISCFSEQHQKYIRAAVDLRDEFSVITMRSYLLSQGNWHDSDERYISRIMSSDTNVPISYALSELRRLHYHISEYQTRYQELIDTMLKNEMPRKSDIAPIDFSQPVPVESHGWIIPNFLPTGLTVLTGLGASGKTQIAVQMAIHALLQLPLCQNHAKGEPIHRVVYVTAEDTHKEITTRALRYFQYLVKTKSVTPEDVNKLQNRFFVIELDSPLCTTQYGSVVTTPQYAQLCQITQPNDLVIIDALSSAFLFSTNDSTQTQAVFYYLKNIKANLLILHHLNKLALRAITIEGLAASVLGSVSIMNRPRVVLMLWNSLFFTLKTNISDLALVWAPYAQEEKIIDTTSQVLVTGLDVYSIIEQEFSRIAEELAEKRGENNHEKHKKNYKKQEVGYEPF